MRTATPLGRLAPAPCPSGIRRLRCTGRTSSSVGIRLNGVQDGSDVSFTSEKSLNRRTKRELIEHIADLERQNASLLEELALYNPKATLTPAVPAPTSPKHTARSLSESSYDDAMSTFPGGDGYLDANAKEQQLDFESTEALIQALNDGVAWPLAGGEFWKADPRKEGHSFVLSEDLQDLYEGEVHAGHEALHIVHVTAEMAPLAKVGGLGDVVTGLGAASLGRGHAVDVILPFYECIETSQVQDLRLEMTFQSPTAGRTTTFEAWRGSIEGVPVVLLRPLDSPFFRGSAIYGGSYNETQAYLVFCRASLEFMAQAGLNPNIIHAHEWQGSAVPMLFWELYSSKMPSSHPILTIHNMDNTGECRQDEFAATGVSGALFASVDKALDERTIGHNPERLCLLKGGIIYSSAVTTVSPTYAKETLSGGGAGFLQSTLARPDVANKYVGILNGIDTNVWNPATDPYLPACFSSSVPQGKAICKAYLQRGLGLDEDPDKPLVAVISRLVPQKGIHLIEHAAIKTVENEGQFVLLGTGHADGGLRALANDKFKGNKNVSMMFMYSDALSHLIYAAADIFLVPSMFEPCGLTQMIALRYGGVPLVRRTGGLADTVQDIDAAEESEESFLGGPSQGNGFVFDGVDSYSIESTLERALEKYRRTPEAWKRLSARNMRDSTRFSWQNSMSSYEQLYLGVR
jgi:starch synthase